MSLRLRLLSHWTPHFMMVREIERVRSCTDASLDALLAEHVPEALAEEPEMAGPGAPERRAAMARSHERKVRALVNAVGRERAIALGREALFRTGMELGKDARHRLGARETKEDLMRAAGVLYRILGIEFVIMAGQECERMEVTRCALSAHYSPEACAILSAVDEGTISGLNPGASMRFREHITDGCPRCVAIVDFKEER